jgi:hypothetical protein
VALPRERVADDLAEVGIVVDDEDVAHGVGE